MFFIFPFGIFEKGKCKSLVGFTMQKYCGSSYYSFVFLEISLIALKVVGSWLQSQELVIEKENLTE